MVAAATTFGLVVLAIALALTMIRLVRGPVLEDRVVALDLMTTSAVCLAVVLAIHYDAAELIDFAVVFALVAFVGTVAFAHYLERGERK